MRRAYRPALRRLGLARVEALLEQPPHLLAAQLARPRPPERRLLERQQTDVGVSAAVAAGVALGLGQRPQAPEHARERTDAPGRRGRTPLAFGAVPRRKRSEYDVTIDANGRASLGGVPAPSIPLPTEWTPEHLLLSALARCVMTSLGHHCRRDRLHVAATVDASGAVFERDDGSWGFVEIECRVDASVEPAPASEAQRDLVTRAQRGCFIGASLDPRPTYRWRVNGVDVAT